MKTLLAGATMITGMGSAPIPNSAVLIDGEQIIGVGASDDFPRNDKTTLIDVEEKWLLPGLINMHDHLMFRDAWAPDIASKGSVEKTIICARNAAIALMRGWTTVRDMGAIDGIVLRIRDQINKGCLPGPRVLAPGSPICITGGHANFLCVEADGADACRKAARIQLARGADFLKVMASNEPCRMPGPEYARPEMSLEEIRAVFEEATRWGKPAACHVTGSTAIKNVLDAGAHILDHGHYLDDALAERMAAEGVALCPTLSVYDRQLMTPRWQREEEGEVPDYGVLIEPHQRSFEAALRAGVSIVAGTDNCGIYAEEVELMRLGGMSAMDSLLACTSKAAEALGLQEKIGSIRAGLTADLVVLNSDPLRDPYALDDVHLVVREGRFYAPRDLALLAEGEARISTV